MQSRRQLDSGTDESSQRKAPPLDVLFDILITLSAFQLISLKLVCKDWYRMLCSLEFRRAHFQYWRNRSCILFSNSDDSLFFCRNVAEFVPTVRHLIFLPSLRRKLSVFDTLDGLILFGEDSKVYVCNPVTRRVRTVFETPYLSIQPRGRIQYKLVFDPVIRRYKVLAFFVGRENSMDLSYCLWVLEAEDEQGRRSQLRPSWRDLRPRDWDSPSRKLIVNPISSPVIFDQRMMVWTGYVQDENAGTDVAALYLMDFVRARIEIFTIMLPCQRKWETWAGFRALQVEGIPAGSFMVAVPASRLELKLLVVDYNARRWRTWHKVSVRSSLGWAVLGPRSAYPLINFQIVGVMNFDGDDTRLIVHNRNGTFMYFVKTREIVRVSEFVARCTFSPSLVEWDGQT